MFVRKWVNIYIVVGGIDTYDKWNINPLLSIMCNKKKAGRKKTSNEKLSYTEVWNGREMFPLFAKSWLFHLNMSACQNLRAGNVSGAAFMAYGETEKQQHKNNIDDLWSWGTRQNLHYYTKKY